MLEGPRWRSGSTPPRPHTAQQTLRPFDAEHEYKRRHSKASDKDDESTQRQRSKHRDSLESLRQRRLERETVESNRAAVVLMERDDDGIWKNERKRSYHNQYNPGLSRT